MEDGISYSEGRGQRDVTMAPPTLIKNLRQMHHAVDRKSGDTLQPRTQPPLDIHANNAACNVRETACFAWEQ